MFDIGFSEIVVIAIVAIIVIGPEKMPETLRMVMSLIHKVRNTVSGFKQEIHNELKIDEITSSIKTQSDEIGLSNLNQTLRKNFNAFSKESHQIAKQARNEFQPIIEAENRQFLATGKAIQHFNYQDLSAQDKKNESFEDDFHDDFSDFYTQDTSNAQSSQNKRYSEHIRYVLAQRQMRLNIREKSPAYLVMYIHERYQHRFLLEEHELIEAYTTRLESLNRPNDINIPQD